MLLGTYDENSPLYKLAGHSDLLQFIWSLVKKAWAAELIAATMTQEQVAFAHVENVKFPKSHGRSVNMMPFIMGDKSTLPAELADYWPMIEVCVSTLSRRSGTASDVGYLTVQESVVKEGDSQRRPGLHTEGFTRAPFDAGVVRNLPHWHPWGFGSVMRSGQFDGGIFMASNVSDSCHLYNAIVPNELVGKGGDVEHLRDVLNVHFPNQPKPRTRWPNDRSRYGSHAGCARLHMHLEGDDIFNQVPVRGPISLQADELIWMTDRTPHESVPLEAGQPRQFFRLVTGGIDTWFAAHSTPNPLGIQPEAQVVDYDKFVGPAPAPSSDGTGGPIATAAAASIDGTGEPIDAVADASIYVNVKKEHGKATVNETRFWFRRLRAALLCSADDA